MGSSSRRDFWGAAAGETKRRLTLIAVPSHSLRRHRSRAAVKDARAWNAITAHRAAGLSSQTGVPNGDPGGRSHARPSLIRPGHPGARRGRLLPAGESVPREVHPASEAFRAREQ